MIDKNSFSKKLNTDVFGRHFYSLDTIDSTNRYALELARSGEPQGTVVAADYQTGGKGRLNRSWISPPGKNLLFSIILYPQKTIESAQKITLGAAVSVHKTITQLLAGLAIKDNTLEVKWPNDVIANDKKLCGILTESVLKNNRIAALVMGFGINLNMDPEDAGPDLAPGVISLKRIIGQEINRSGFLAAFLKQFEADYFDMEKHSYINVVAQWKARSNCFGKSIRVNTGYGMEDAVFYDLSEQGYLMYKKSDGTIWELAAGEALWQ